MRAEDAARSEIPFDPTDDLEIAFPEAIGVDLPEVEYLYREIFNDLDNKVFGVGWWAPHPGTSRRILISTYLLECVRSIRTNLTEAALHLLEAVDNWDKEGNFLAECVQIKQGGQYSINIPQRKKPADDLPRRMATLHAVGFIRALVGALDCLGASIVGVLALPTSISFADFKSARIALKRSKNPFHAKFSADLENLVASAGPINWADWSIDFRNMVVHRGRRIHITQVVPREISLYGPAGRVVTRATIAEHLPSDPCCSQVEAFVGETRPPVLTEHGEVTLRGTLSSSIEVIRKTAGELSQAWATRRKDPNFLIQPRENWPTIRNEPQMDFNGYKPGSTPYKPQEWRAHADLYKIFTTAALSNDLRAQWKTFD